MRDTTTFMKPRDGADLHVLLVEDNPGDAELLRMNLKRILHFSTQITAVESLEDALRELSLKNYQLCISDLGLPDSSGLDTVRSLCEKHGTVPLIVLTGNNDPEMGATVVRAGAQDYLVKGQLETGELSRVIRYTLERHRFQSRIRDYENLLHSSLDSMKAEVAVLNADGVILFTNNSWANSQAGLENPFNDMKPGGDFFRACQHVDPPLAPLWLSILERVQECLQGDQPETCSFQHDLTLEDSHLWFEIKVFSFIHRSSRHVFLSKEDITSRRKMEEQIEFQASVLNQISDCVTVTDLEGRVTYANEASCRLLDKSMDELMGTSVEGFGENPTRGGTQAEIIRRTLQEGFWRGEIVNVDRQGKELLLDCRTKLVLDEQGQPVAMCGISTDITQKRESEELRSSLQAELHHSQKLEAIGHLAGGVAHDFNNMLQAITGNCELALMEAGEQSDLRQELLEIKSASEHAANLARQLLAFARKQAANPRELELNEAVASMLRMLQRLIGENIQLQWSPDSEPVHVWMDPSQLDQILANLAVNARDAIQGQGILTISLSKAPLPDSFLHPAGKTLAASLKEENETYAMLTIRDNGCGMPEDILDRIFEPFFTTKPLGKGTGLGLSTVYGIVRQNHGFVEVSSQPGKGTTFHLFFKLHGHSSPRPAEALVPVPEPPPGKGRILLVEDEISILRVTTKCLQNLGYHVSDFNNPLKAVEALGQSSQRFDLLITDVIMPEMNGRMLAEEFRKTHPDIPVLYISGYSSDVLAGEGLRSQKNHLLKKPFELRTLASKVSDLLQ